MVDNLIEEVFVAAIRADLAETGGGHNQKGVDFQRAWALARMFELETHGAQNYLFLFESIQDVAEMDSDIDPKEICIYQVKKKDRGEWKWKELTGLLEPGTAKATKQDVAEIKFSPIGKLYSSVLAFKGLRSSGRFISNSGCNIQLNDGSNAATSLPCDLSKLDAEYLDLLSKGLDTLHAAETLPCEPARIHVERVSLPPDAPATHLKGIAVAFLDSRSPKHAGQASSFVDALLAKVGPLGAKTDKCSSFDELRKERGFSKAEFASALMTLEQLPDHVANVNDLLTQLQTEQYIDAMTAISIRGRVATIFQQQLMGVEDTQLKALVTSIDTWLADNAAGPKFSTFVQSAVEALLPAYPTLRQPEFLAHFLLRTSNYASRP